MKITSEVLRWLKDNAYAVKGEDYWFLPDFPTDQTPDKLEIPINKRKWLNIKAT